MYANLMMPIDAFVLSPVMVKKHWAPTDLHQLASEILALSKVNRNTFDLYTRLSATITSSNEVARIGMNSIQKPS